MKPTPQIFDFECGPFVVATPIPDYTGPAPILYADGVHDDTEALQAFLSGEPFRIAGGYEGVLHHQIYVSQGEFLLSKGLEGGGSDVVVQNSAFICAPEFEGEYYLHHLSCSGHVRIRSHAGHLIAYWSQTPSPEGKGPERATIRHRTDAEWEATLRSAAAR
ncbi:MAG: hypothetical protein GYB49_09585 [Alphaproteobacteria bacterium]|nr:hypothetical protein [Alphaproteobacteria bacterium]